MTYQAAHNPESSFDARRFASDVKQLSTPSDLRSAAAIAFEYLVIGTVAACAIWSGHWLVFGVAAIIIAARQHALGVLFHDAAHYRLFSNRFVNDLVSDVCLAFPLGISTSLYRAHHMNHHRFVNDDELDPDKACVHDDDEWEWPKTKWACLGLFLRDVTGLSVFSLSKIIWSRWSTWPHLVPFLMRNSQYAPTPREKLLLLGWTLAFGSVVFLTRSWPYLLLLWIVPACTGLVVIFRIRALAEHYGVGDTHALNHSRTVIPYLWERFLLCPYNVNYHLEHHLFPSVPFSKLHLLHRRLMKDAQYASQAQLTLGYGTVLGELLKQGS